MTLELPKQPRPKPTAIPPGGKKHPPGARPGYYSSKFHLAVFAMALIFVGWCMTGHSEETFGEWVMGELGAAGIYSTSRVAESLAMRKKKDEEEPEQ